MIANYINTHQAEFWILLGFILIVLEIMAGFVAGILLFIGLGTLATGFLMLSGLLPETWLYGITSVGVCSSIITGLLWKPMQKLQGDHEIKKDNSSDLIGLEFNIEQDISSTSPGRHKYSGIEWKVEIDSGADISELKAGQRVAVTSVDVALFKVKPV